MSRISKKTMDKQNPPGKEVCCNYSDAAFGRECEKKRVLKHYRQLIAWKWATAIVLVSILLCANHFRVFGKRIGIRIWNRDRIKADSTIADLGIERPDLLPLTDSEIKKAEEKVRKAEEAERKKFIDEHDGHTICIFVCKCPEKHIRKKCRYCGKKNENQYAYRRERKRR